ncbi:MAG: response regulator [Bacteroidetes bacterium]|nr:response regulator [Bacteroidota bacterium]
MSVENGNPIYKRVMIIDDTYVDRYVAERNILKYGISSEVISKESAKAGLEYLKSCESNPSLLPELIFLDIRMPEMDGFGFLDEYEKLPEAVKGNCVVMMLSTSLNPEDHERVKGNKYVSRFLNKPLDKEKIEILLSN